MNAELTRQLQRWERFRTGRTLALAADHGWLSLTSYQWLPAMPSKLDAVPGLWSASATSATLTAVATDGMTLVSDGSVVDGTVELFLAPEDSLLWVQFGSVVVEVGVRADRYMIRTRDSQSPTLAAFSGVPMFDYNPDLVVNAHFEAFPEARNMPIETSRPDVPAVAPLVGEVVFELEGDTYRLAAEEGKLGSLIVTFFDDSNGHGSAHWRKVELTRPRPDGSVVVDFNRSINYPSAFTDFGTCPAPVVGNRIGVAIEAGERNPR